MALAQSCDGDAGTVTVYADACLDNLTVLLLLRILVNEMLLCGAGDDALPSTDFKTGRISFARRLTPDAFAIVSNSSYIPYASRLKGF